MRSSRTEYIRKLELDVREYLPTLEQLLGPRDKRFEFRTIRKSDDDRPRINFVDKYHTNGGCEVDILITDDPWYNKYPDQGTWQVAHECVHFLDPVDFCNEGSCYLEEGLAAWFQDEPKFHDDVVKKYIARMKEGSRLAIYLDAKKRAISCGIDDLTTAVKEIRRSGERIRDITLDDLAKYLDVDEQILGKLFETWPENKQRK